MKTRSFLSLVLMTLLNVFTALAQTNTLTIPDVTVAAGKSIQLPVYLDNTADIVAVQFTLTVPEGLTLSPTTAALTERATDHSLTMKSIGGRKYMAMLFSSTNQAVTGRTGQLLSVELAADASLEDGTELSLALSDVVIGMADGSNLTTGFSAGKVTITVCPDLAVAAVGVLANDIQPGSSLSVNWQVNNVGGLATEAGWSEQIYLDGQDGASKLLGTVYYEGTLAAGSMVSRSAELAVPQILGVSGVANVRVKLVPDSQTGEPAWLRGNNEAQTASAQTVGKVLQLTPAEVSVEEQTRQVRFYLTRSGSTVNDETFLLAATSDSRVSLPESVTIPKGQSGAYFYAQLTANGLLDDTSVVCLALSGNDYAEVSANMEIEDDTFPSLSLSVSSQDVTEGGTFSLVVTAERVPQQDLEISLSCDLASRFNIPSSLIIPAGKTRVEVTVEVKDDDVPDVEQVATFTASAARYNAASETIILLDNDVPTLQLSLTPTAVSEAADPVAVVATLRRIDNKDKQVTVKFFDDSEGGIYYSNQTVNMAPGVEELTLNLGPIDNNLVDGERTYHISAAVWIASCSCNASNGTSGGVVTVPLTVYDNDGPALSISSSSSLLKEGSEITLTVGRNTQTAEALTVRLSSDHDTELQYPATVIIPAGQTSVTFVVKSVKNAVSGDSFNAVLTAECEGMATANTWFTVSDQTLPDAQLSALTVSDTEVEVGSEVTVSTTLANVGFYELPELTKVGFYVGNSSSPAITAYLQAPLSPGESVTLSKTLTLPAAVGTYHIYAVANYDKAMKELVYTNNQSNAVQIAIVSPYSYTVQTDKEVYRSGESIRITGRVTGRDVAKKHCEVYIVNAGYRHVIDVETDENGAFSTSYEPYAAQMGHFLVGVCYPGEGLTEEMAAFNVYGLKLVSNAAITCNALVGDIYQGKFFVSNPAAVSLSGIKATVLSAPDHCKVRLAAPESIVAGKSADIGFEIESNTVTEGNDWELIKVRLESAEGASLYGAQNEAYKLG